MAITKAVESTSISIEVQNGADKAGDPTFTKKTFQMSKRLQILKLYMMLLMQSNTSWIV